MLGILIFLMPPLFGEGYVTLQLLQGTNPEQINQLIQFEFLKTNINTVLIFLAAVFLAVSGAALISVRTVIIAINARMLRLKTEIK